MIKYGIFYLKFYHNQNASMFKKYGVYSIPKLLHKYFCINYDTRKSIHAQANLGEIYQLTWLFIPRTKSIKKKSADHTGLKGKWMTTSG